MALVKCRECGGQVSKKAEKCPHCGAPVKRQGLGCGSLILIVLGVFVVTSIMISISAITQPVHKPPIITRPVPKPPTITRPAPKPPTITDPARSLVIRHIEPNKLKVGGREFQTKPNPVGDGYFVYDPRTRFFGVERYLIWWVPKENIAYPLNSPSKMVTPNLKWPREDGVKSPSAGDVIDYIFKGKPMTPAKTTKPPATSETKSFTTKEYRIYRAIIDTPMSIPESEALKNVSKRFGVSTDEAKTIAHKVMDALSKNDWFGSPESEVRHASDWKH